MNQIGWAKIYCDTWFGAYETYSNLVIESYPNCEFNIPLTVDTILFSVDSDIITADQTIY